MKKSVDSKTSLAEAKNIEDISLDDLMVEKTNKVLNLLDSFSNETISENVILTVLKTQQLVKEIYEDVSED